MSTKTMKQRIALVAASALTAGFLSVVAMPAANAAAAGEIASISGTGILSESLTGRTTTKTATLLKTGSLTVAVNAASGYYTVTSGAVITGSAGTSDVVDADQTGFTSGNADNTFTITPQGAVGSTFTITGYASTAMASIVHVLTVTIAGASVAAVPTVADSIIVWNSDGTTANTTGVENATYAATTYTNPLYLMINLKDAYGTSLTAATGGLIATASAGAVLKQGDNAVSGKGTTSTVVATGDLDDLYISVYETTAGAGWAGTVTISYNGVTLATKSGKITGAPASLTISAKKVGTNSTTSTDAIGYQVKDTAGNNVVVSRSSILFSSSTNALMLGAVAAGTADNTTSAEGNITPTCTASSSLYGTANLVLSYTLPNGATIKSNALPFTCGGSAVAYTASWDKAAYAQGDVAKLTVQFKDSKGGVANSYGIVSDATTADQAITANQMERVTAHTVSMKPDSKGQVVYTFTVGTSTGVVAGKYNAVVSFPTTNTAGAALGTANVAASYEVQASGAVSNADVLKSIVALIASINKQIQALQKLILKR